MQSTVRDQAYSCGIATSLPAFLNSIDNSRHAVTSQVGLDESGVPFEMSLRFETFRLNTQSPASCAEGFP